MDQASPYCPPYLEALRQGNVEAAEGVIQAALSANLSLVEIYQSVMQPALAEVGKLWEHGRLSIAQEHRATQITEALIGRPDIKPAAPNGFLPFGERRFLIAAVYPNQHHLGTYMVTSLLQQAGWTVRNLGAAVLVTELRHHTRVYKPHIIGLSMAMTSQMPAFKQAVHILKTRWPGLPVIIGGAAIQIDPAVADEIGADVAAFDAAEGIRLAQDLMARQANDTMQRFS